MVNVTARIKIKNKQYEIDVDLDEALKVRAGKGNLAQALVSPQVFVDLKKGLRPSNADLTDAFGTTDVYEIAKKIIMSGEVQKTQEFRDAEREARVKQVVDLIIRNAVDQHGRPYTAERITRAMAEAHFNPDTRPAEQQLHAAIDALKNLIPIKVEVKRIKLIVPARFSGQVYGIIKDMKESEEWLANGDLEVIMSVPAGMQLDFYDKLNGITHGAARSEELPEKV